MNYQINLHIVLSLNGIKGQGQWAAWLPLCVCVWVCVSVVCEQVGQGERGVYMCVMKTEGEKVSDFPLVIGAQSEVPSCRKQSAWHMSAQPTTHTNTHIQKYTNKIIDKHTITDTCSYPEPEITLEITWRVYRGHKERGPDCVRVNADSQGPEVRRQVGRLVC